METVLRKGTGLASKSGLGADRTACVRLRAKPQAARSARSARTARTTHDAPQQDRRFAPSVVQANTRSARKWAGESNAQAADASNSPEVESPALQPAKLVPFIFSVGLGVIINFLVPRPDGVSREAWRLLSIFVSTVAGLVVGPLPVGAWAFAGVTAALASKTLTFSAAFSAFNADVIWLVVNAFFLAKGFVKSGLGDRVATHFVKLFGSSSLGLSYGLTVSEGILSPSMPSSTARCGGVYLPIIVSLAKQAGSLPGKTANKLGAFLAQAQLQTTGHLSSISLTGAAQNSLGLLLAANLGHAVPNPWITWFKAGIVPGLVGLILTPLIVYKICPPEIKETPEAPKIAAKKLQDMGPMRKIEWMVAGTMLATMVLWIVGDAIGISGASAAMIGITMQMIGGVLAWDDLLGEKGAWDTLIWFAALVGMSAQLKNLGLIAHLSNGVNSFLATMNMGWPAVFVGLHTAYFLLHYLFASQTAQLAALGAAFLATMIGAGTPPILAALTIPFHTNLFGAITHYASGQAAVYYGSGYYDMKTTFRVGAIIGVLNLVIWGVVGAFWWKLIGIY